MIHRRTLGAEAVLEGPGLFTGAACRVTLRPAASGAGLTFIRDGARIGASITALCAEPVHPAFTATSARSTNLAAGAARALTVEHILSALAALGVTDADIELSAPEVPILDGSARDFAAAIAAAGIQQIGPDPIEPITLTEPITVDQRGASITASPRSEPGWSITYHLDYGPGAPIPAQTATWDGAAATYSGQIAPARTFCTEQEAIAMRQAGLFSHLSPQQMLVIGPHGPIENALRFENEPARHKLLDVIGDLALTGRPIQADITARRSGHAMNHQLARLLIS